MEIEGGWEGEMALFLPRLCQGGKGGKVRDRRPGKQSRHDGGGNLSGLFEEMRDSDGDAILQAVLRIRGDEGA